jgi:hypothetical protein
LAIPADIDLIDYTCSCGKVCLEFSRPR